MGTCTHMPSLREGSAQAEAADPEGMDSSRAAIRASAHSSSNAPVVGAGTIGSVSTPTTKQPVHFPTCSWGRLLHSPVWPGRRTA